MTPRDDYDRSTVLGQERADGHRGEANVDTLTDAFHSEGDITTPFGGYNESGFGGRDGGFEAFEQHTQKKTIWFALRG